MYCIMFHSIRLGRWNLHFHRGTLRFQPLFQVSVQSWGLYFYKSALLFTSLIYLFSPASVSITSQLELEQRCQSLSLPSFVFESFTASSQEFCHTVLYGAFSQCSKSYLFYFDYELRSLWVQAMFLSLVVTRLYFSSLSYSFFFVCHFVSYETGRWLIQVYSAILTDLLSRFLFGSNSS